METSIRLQLEVQLHMLAKASRLEVLEHESTTNEQTHNIKQTSEHAHTKHTRAFTDTLAHQHT